MRITKMEIESDDGGRKVELVAIDGGAWAWVGDNIIAGLFADWSPEARYSSARDVAKVIYGVDRKHGGPNATNSMVHDVLAAFEQVAGI